MFDGTVLGLRLSCSATLNSQISTPIPRRPQNHLAPDEPDVGVRDVPETMTCCSDRGARAGLDLGFGSGGLDCGLSCLGAPAGISVRTLSWVCSATVSSTSDTRDDSPENPFLFFSSLNESSLIQ